MCFDRSAQQHDKRQISVFWLAEQHKMKCVVCACTTGDAVSASAGACDEGEIEEARGERAGADAAFAGEQDMRKADAGRERREIRPGGCPLFPCIDGEG